MCPAPEACAGLAARARARARALLPGPGARAPRLRASPRSQRAPTRRPGPCAVCQPGLWGFCFFFPGRVEVALGTGVPLGFLASFSGPGQASAVRPPGLCAAPHPRLPAPPLLRVSIFRKLALGSIVPNRCDLQFPGGSGLRCRGGWGAVGEGTSPGPRELSQPRAVAVGTWTLPCGPLRGPLRVPAAAGPRASPSPSAWPVLSPKEPLTDSLCMCSFK